MRLKFLLFLALAVLAVLIGFDFWQKNQEAVNSNQKVLGEPAPNLSENSVDLAFNNQSFRVAWYQASDLDRLLLIPNFEAKLGSREIKQKNNCEFLVSGGFYRKVASSAYSEDDKPTGFFLTEGQVLQNFIPNKLLPGVLSVNSMATPRITREVPEDELRLGLQAGPILRENSFASKLNLTRDEPARRVVVATTGNNKLYFLIFWNPNSFFQGPFLADLPELLEVFSEKTGITFADALNLDGGTATAFSIPDLQLSEGTKVGSFFCVKN